MAWDEQLAVLGFVVTSEYIPPEQQTPEQQSQARYARGPMMRRTAKGHGQTFEVIGCGDGCATRLLKQVLAWKEGSPEVQLSQPVGLVVTEEERGVKFEHPAYGTINVCRFSGTSALFGAKVRETYGGVVLRIGGAAHIFNTLEGVYDGTAPRVWEQERLIEVRMSMSQWGEVVSASMGGSIPCTIEYHPEHGRVHMPDDPQQNHQDAVRISAKQRMAKATEEIRAMQAELGQSMSGPGPLKATEKQELWQRINRFTARIIDGLPFLGAQFDEAMQESLAEARTEFRTNFEEIAAVKGVGALDALPEGGSR
jgi:hypothetical protein